MTEGNGHVIDPNGDARRALQEAVAEHGPEVLSNVALMDTVCRDHLTGLPGESILIGNAARTNVPALLNELIPRLGNYGAIQSAAASLAGEHNLDMAASLWVVREYARALGYIAPGTATGTSTSFPGSGPRPVPGSGPRPVPGSGPVPSSGPVTGAGSAGSMAQIPVAPSPAGTTGAGEGSGTAEASREEAGGTGPGGGEAGSAGAAGAAAGAGAGAGAGEAFRDESAGSKASTSGAAAGGAGDTSGAAAASGSTASGSAASQSDASQGAADGSFAGSGGPAGTGPIGGSPVGTEPTGEVPAADGSRGRPWSEAPATGRSQGRPWGEAPAAGNTGGSGPWGGAPGGGLPEGEPDFPLPLPAGRLPGRQRSKVLNRNTVGIAAAVALVAGYLGVASVAHLSPFPAKTPSVASSSQSSSPPASASSSPASSPDPSADPSPTSQLDILLTKVPAAIRNQDNQNSCLNAGTQFGATAVSQCQHLQRLAAQVIIYYLYPNRAALASGLSAFLKAQKFKKIRECTDSKGSFADFLVDCQSDFTVKRLGLTGSVAEYTNRTASQNPIIVSTDNEQNVMAVLIGTNDGDLLAYWNQQKWVVTS